MSFSYVIVSQNNRPLFPVWRGSWRLTKRCLVFWCFLITSYDALQKEEFFSHLQQSYKASIAYFKERMGTAHCFDWLKYCFFAIIPSFPLFCKFWFVLRHGGGEGMQHPSDGSQPNAGKAHCEICKKTFFILCFDPQQNG